MGLFDRFKDAAIGKLTAIAAEHGPLGQQLSSLINQHGGLDGLVQAFKDKGLAKAAASWVGTGTNLPVTSEQITRVLGNDKIKALAAQWGISTEEVSQQLAQHLPGLIDKLSKKPSSD